MKYKLQNISNWKYIAKRLKHKKTKGEDRRLGCSWRTAITTHQTSFAKLITSFKVWSMYSLTELSHDWIILVITFKNPFLYPSSWFCFIELIIRVRTWEGSRHQYRVYQECFKISLCVSSFKSCWQCFVHWCAWHKKIIFYVILYFVLQTKVSRKKDYNTTF